MRLSSSKCFATTFVDLPVYRHSFAILLTLMPCVATNMQALMENTYPKMINIKRDQKHFKTIKLYILSLFR